MLYTKPGVLMCLQKALVLITLCRKAETRSGPIYSNIQLKGCSWVIFFFFFYCIVECWEKLLVASIAHSVAMLFFCLSEREKNFKSVWTNCRVHRGSFQQSPVIPSHCFSPSELCHQKALEAVDFLENLPGPRERPIPLNHEPLPPPPPFPCPFNILCNMGIKPYLILFATRPWEIWS